MRTFISSITSGLNKNYITFTKRHFSFAMRRGVAPYSFSTWTSILFYSRFATSYAM